MSSPAEGAKSLLITAGVGTLVDAWPIVVSRMPTSPNAAIAVFDTGNAEHSDPKFLLDYLTFQVLVRGAKDGYSDMYQKAIDCRDVLLGMISQEINGDWWDGITHMSGPINLGYDQQERPLTSINFRVIIEPAQSALTNRVPL